MSPIHPLSCMVQPAIGAVLGVLVALPAQSWPMHV
ncbi:MAG: hypothetical protein CAPSK01_000619 [Candidatus Accumulibacter vicinus]|uniref:Uncharacterized protein n=1 Tax=Candidatus Accumulibacter vicinus TaxID=2954382 RepID=A0A084Y4N0_9PROT|nr:MAG: hypothetical protein CAPSK01_000619 [Candidatus Accumulibacter vicinus]